MSAVTTLAAAATGRIDSGDTAWMLTATALVIMMTPALGLFYAGLVRAKSTLNTFMMCLAALAVATVCWAAVGYSLAFDGNGSLIGGLGNAFLHGVTFAPRDGSTIPQLGSLGSTPVRRRVASSTERHQPSTVSWSCVLV